MSKQRYELLLSEGEVAWANRTVNVGYKHRLGDTLQERPSAALREWRRECARVVHAAIAAVPLANQ